MSHGDPIAPLIPWYVNGTLEAEERRRVEGHLSGCEGCRALLASARGQATQAAPGDLASMERHVHPRLLTAYAEEPESLEEETARWVEAKLEKCPTCRAAYERLLEVEARLGRAPLPEPVRRAGPARRVWELLSSTVLQPAPALAYLVLLALVVPWLLREGEPEPGAPPLTSPSVMTVQGERASRAESGAEPVAPLVLEQGRGAVLLELLTELTPEDLARPGLDWSVELARDGETVWSERHEAGGLGTREGAVVVPVVLDPDRLDAGDGYDLSLRIRRPGDPLDGQALFRRAIAVKAAGSR